MGKISILAFAIHFLKVYNCIYFGTFVVWEDEERRRRRDKINYRIKKWPREKYGYSDNHLKLYIFHELKLYN